MVTSLQLEKLSLDASKAVMNHMHKWMTYIKNGDYITTTKQSTIKPRAYFLGSIPCSIETDPIGFHLAQSRNG